MQVKHYATPMRIAIGNLVDRLLQYKHRPWTLPVHPVVFPPGMPRRPHNGLTRNVYTGKNAILTWFAGVVPSGYQDPRFYTLNNASHLGLRLKRAPNGDVEKQSVIGVPIIVPIAPKMDKPKTAPEVEEPEIEEIIETKESKSRPMGYRYAMVYHVSGFEPDPNRPQVSNIQKYLPLDDKVPVLRDTLTNAQENLRQRMLYDYMLERIRELGIQVSIGGTQPLYHKSSHTIHVPAFEKFFNGERAIRTLSHEWAHALPSGQGGRRREAYQAIERLQEHYPKLAGDQKLLRGIEEVIAEMTACQAAAHLGGLAHQDESYAYISQWMAHAADAFQEASGIETIYTDEASGEEKVRKNSPFLDVVSSACTDVYNLVRQICPKNLGARLLQGILDADADSRQAIMPILSFYEEAPTIPEMSNPEPEPVQEQPEVSSPASMFRW